MTQKPSERIKEIFDRRIELPPGMYRLGSTEIRIATILQAISDYLDEQWEQEHGNKENIDMVKGIKESLAP